MRDNMLNFTDYKILILIPNLSTKVSHSVAFSLEPLSLDLDDHFIVHVTKFDVKFWLCHFFKLIVN